MKSLIIVTCIIFSFPLTGQHDISVTNDTLFNSQDSVVVLVTQSIDSMKTAEYYGAYTEYEYHSNRYGFLWLKKATYRSRHISHRWGAVYYDEWRKVYPGLRICMDDIELFGIERLE